MSGGRNERIIVIGGARPCTNQGAEKMKYMISWCEQPPGSPGEYENAQKRILEVFGQLSAKDEIMQDPADYAFR